VLLVLIMLDTGMDTGLDHKATQVAFEHFAKPAAAS
jgi:hypothetical protein